jgi:citrate lyase beta subunit
MGFKGKFAIHPNQVPVLNKIFGVTEEEYKEAKNIVLVR